MTDKSKKKKQYITASELDIKKVYTKADLPQESSGEDELPGKFPYTRGIHDSMYRGKLWTMRQYAGFGTAAEANQRYKYLLSRGTTGLSVAFDLPTQMGRDSDHALARGEVGKVGVAISSIEDMHELLDGIPLRDVSLSMTINATAAILLAMVLVHAEEEKIPWKELRGTVQNDILKEYIARGTYIYPPAHGLRLVTDLFEYCSQEVPQWNTISISGYHIREAGSTAVEELAFTLADGIAYVEAALKKGLKVDDFAPRLAFFFNAHNDFLEEVAKFRAARKLWATIMRDRFGAKNEKSLLLRFHVQTAGSSLTAQQPLNNVVRTSLQALAAVFGGAQSLHTNSYDEALGLPTEQSAEVALRTQQIIAHETGVIGSADPLGGSYLLESWTERLVRQASERIEYIDSLGGMIAAIEAGYPQGEIESSAYAYQRRIESGDQVIVGVNSYRSKEDEAVDLNSMDPKGESGQQERLQRFRKDRNATRVSKALEKLQKASQGHENLMPFIVQAIRDRVTLGEISDCLRLQFGEHSDSATFS